MVRVTRTITVAAVMLGLVWMAGCGGGGGDTSIAAPTGLAVLNTTSGTVTIGWVDQATNETGYEVQRRDPGGSWATLNNLAAGSQQYIDGAVFPATTYEYRVRAFAGTDASAWTGPVPGTTNPGESDTPNPPTSLNVVSTTSTTITLGWTDQSQIETGYEVQRKTATTSFAKVGEAAANATQYTDSGLTEGTPYEYRVRALGSVNNSAWSSSVIASPGGNGGIGSVHGRVVSLVGIVPLVGAQVTLGGVYMTTTGSDGTYVLNNIPAAHYTLTATATGYVQSTSNVEVKDGQNNIPDVLLASQGTGPPPPPIW